MRKVKTSFVKGKITNKVVSERCFCKGENRWRSPERYLKKRDEWQEYGVLRLNVAEVAFLRDWVIGSYVGRKKMESVWLEVDMSLN